MKSLAAFLTAALISFNPNPIRGEAMRPDFVETPLTLEVDGLRIPAMLTVPAGSDPVSAILLVPGSLFSDVDGDYPSWNIHPHMYADLARQLAARGHAVLRYAKPGPGTGTVAVDPERAKVHFHFAERVVVARAALAAFRAALGDKAHAVRAWTVAGHSEGAVVASLLAPQEPSLDGIVSLSGPGVGLLGIMRDQVAAMPGGGDLSLYDDALARIRRGEPLAPEAAHHPQTAMLATLAPGSLNYIREVDAVDPARALAAVESPVLLVQGGGTAASPRSTLIGCWRREGRAPPRSPCSTTSSTSTSTPSPKWTRRPPSPSPPRPTRGSPRRSTAGWARCAKRVRKRGGMWRKLPARGTRRESVLEAGLEGVTSSERCRGCCRTPPA
jgi:dienelactone hydrolase